MTLVVARLLPSQICMIGDTKITDPNAINGGGLRGALKVVILSRSLVIGFAGTVGRAQWAIEQIAQNLNRYANFADVTRWLAKEGCNPFTDFIAATLEPTSALCRIQLGSIAPISSTWVGNLNAFEHYQEIIHGLPETYDDRISADDYTAGKMAQAFHQLLREGQDSIDGPHIRVVSTRDGFVYAPDASATFDHSQNVSGHNWAALNFGSAATGGYAYTICTPLEAGIGAVGVYFTQGRFGALFYPTKQPAPYIYRDVDQLVFESSVRSEHGIEIVGNTWS